MAEDATLVDRYDCMMRTLYNDAECLENSNYKIANYLFKSTSKISEGDFIGTKLRCFKDFGRGEELIPKKNFRNN